MSALTEGRNAAEFLMAEGEGNLSRDNIVIKDGSGVVAAGTVLGKITSSGKYVPAPASAQDGSDTAVAIALYNVDATDADVSTVAIFRHAEVNGNILSYDATVDDATKKAAKADDLREVGIIVR